MLIVPVHLEFHTHRTKVHKYLLNKTISINFACTIHKGHLTHFSLPAQIYGHPKSVLLVTLSLYYKCCILAEFRQYWGFNFLLFVQTLPPHQILDSFSFILSLFLSLPPPQKTERVEFFKK